MRRQLLFLLVLPFLALAQYPKPGGGSGGGGGTGLPACGGSVTTNCAPQADGAGNVATGITVLPLWYDVRAYGATGDGSTDDYQAIKDASAAVCATGGTLFFPGTINGARANYYIGRYKITGGSSANGVTDISWTNCNHVQVLGYGALLTVRGNFKRTFDYTSGGSYHASYEDEVTPFVIVTSDDFQIAGLEIYGQVDLMTRDANVVEGGTAYGVYVQGSTHVSLRDLNIHHFEIDGIYVSKSGATASQHVNLFNVRSENNARQGMSIVQGRSITADGNSSFSNTGVTGGSYGNHAPSAGIDIEPGAGVTINVPTGDIRIQNSKIVGNLGHQIISGDSTLVDTLSIQRNIIDSRTNQTSSFAYEAVAQNVDVRDNDFFVGAGTAVYLHNEGSQTQHDAILRMTYSGNRFWLAQNNGLQALQTYSTPWNVSFDNNTVNVVAAGSDTSRLRLQGIQSVTSNSFFVDGAGHPGGGQKSVPEYSAIPAISRNTYSTNVAASNYYSSTYDATSNAQQEASNNAQYYLGGRAYSIFGSIGDVAMPSAIVQNAMNTSANKARLERCYGAAPTSTGATGDICFNSSPGFGQPLGYINAGSTTWANLPPIGDASNNFAFPAEVTAKNVPTAGSAFDAVAILTGSDQIAYYQINGGSNCGGDGSHAIGYTASTHLFGCTAITASLGSAGFDALVGAGGANSIDNAAYTQTWAWNTLAGADGLKLASTSTAAASNAQVLFESALSGANGTSAQTTYAAKVSNLHTGTTSVNVGLSASASGGATNYGLIVPAGYACIGESTCTNPLEVAGNTLIKAATLYLDATHKLALDSGGTTRASIRSSAASSYDITFESNGADWAKIGGSTGTAWFLNPVASTGASKVSIGYDASGTYTGAHTSATTTLLQVMAGQAQSTGHLFDVANNTGTPQTFIDAGYNLTITPQKAASGTVNQLCIDANGLVTSNASACAPTNLPTPSGSFTLAAPHGYGICTTTCTATVPPPTVAGQDFCVQNDDNVSTAITLAGQTGVFYESTTHTGYGTTGGTMTATGAVGNRICMVARDTTHWLVLGYTGTWTAN